MRDNLLWGAVAAIGLVAFLARIPADGFGASPVAVSQSTSSAGMVALPEIGGETVIRQRLLAAPLDGSAEADAATEFLDLAIYEPVFGSRVFDRLLHGTLCVNLLFGTFDRENAGTIRVILVTPSGAYGEIVDISRLPDTTFFPICFSGAPPIHSLVLDGRSELVIEPLQVTRGESVTLWAAPDLRNGRIVDSFPSDTSEGKSLVMYFSAESRADRAIRMLLGVFASTSVALATVAIFGISKSGSRRSRLNRGEPHRRA